MEPELARSNDRRFVASEAINIYGSLFVHAAQIQNQFCDTEYRYSTWVLVVRVKDGKEIDGKLGLG